MSYSFIHQFIHNTVSEENERRVNGTMMEDYDDEDNDLYSDIAEISYEYDEELYEDEEEVEARSAPIPTDPLG